MISFHTSPLARPGGRGAGGMNVYVRQLSLALSRLGHQVDIFTRRAGRGTPRVQPLAAGVRVITLPGGPLNADKDLLHSYLPQFVAALQRFVRGERSRYDIIHSHYWLSGAVGRQLADAWGVPHLTMFHTLGAVKNRSRLSEHEPASRIAEEERIAAAAHRIIVGSEHERRFLEQLYGADTETITTIPLGVDLDHFQPMPRAAARATLGLDERPVILFVGRVEPIKGLDILLMAAAQVAETCDFQLVVVGAEASRNQEMDRARRLTDMLGLTDKVRFVGAVDHHRLPLYYSAADVCAVPSYYESFGLVAVEAMACGVPVVAARVGGLVSTVRDGETGYLIPWHCPEPFAERLELLLLNETLRQRLGERGRAAAEQYRWSAIAARIAEVYGELVSSR
jgi:D-inositol-3-phosphate glycosyltransferase